MASARCSVEGEFAAASLLPRRAKSGSDLDALIAQALAPGLAVTMSGGVAVDPGQGTAAALMRDADLALYEAKRGGRNRVKTSDRTGARSAEDGRPEKLLMENGPGG